MSKAKEPVIYGKIKMRTSDRIAEKYGKPKPLAQPAPESAATATFADANPEGAKPSFMEAYCVKCKEKREAKNVEVRTRTASTHSRAFAQCEDVAQCQSELIPE
ncbi:hypothetical protein IAD21_00200 [Abditibacteriota bacterium]|nr:hypothetical protein IAD21_00200 [Abditibacteriota bacterium]